MTSDSDRIVERAVAKFARRLEEDAKNKKLNGISLVHEEQQQIDFLIEFRKIAHSEIAPVIERARDAINGLPAGSAVEAKIDGPGDGDRIELLIVRNGKTATLTFRANTQRMKIEISSSDGTTRAMRNKSEVTDEDISPLVAGFVERALNSFSESIR